MASNLKDKNYDEPVITGTGPLICKMCKKKKIYDHGAWASHIAGRKHKEAIRKWTYYSTEIIKARMKDFEETEEDSKSQFFLYSVQIEGTYSCLLCNSTSQTYAGMKTHFVGLEHMENLKNSSKSKWVEEAGSTPQSISYYNEPIMFKNSVFCRLCKITVHYLSWTGHVNGRNHAEKLKNVPDYEKLITVENSDAQSSSNCDRPEVNSTVDQVVIENCDKETHSKELTVNKTPSTEALPSRDDVNIKGVEKGNDLRTSGFPCNTISKRKSLGNPDKIRFYCTLCKCKTYTLPSWKEHINGKKHKENLWRCSNWPNKQEDKFNNDSVHNIPVLRKRMKYSSFEIDIGSKYDSRNHQKYDSRNHHGSSFPDNFVDRSPSSYNAAFQLNSAVSNSYNASLFFNHSASHSYVPTATNMQYSYRYSTPYPPSTYSQPNDMGQASYSYPYHNAYNPQHGSITTARRDTWPKILWPS